MGRPLMAGPRSTREMDDRPLSPGPRQPRGRALALEALVFLLVAFCWFGVWAIAKPPYHAPDEMAHHIRAMALPASPWIATSESLTIRSEEWNPLTWTPELGRLVRRPDLHLNAQEVAGLESRAWPAPGETSAQFTQAWTYPPVYYWMLFLPAEAASDALGATPWQSVFVYRLVSSAWAAALWTLVFVGVARIEALWPHRLSLMTFVLANPMLAFMTSSINTDSVHVPLSALWLIESYVLLTGGGWGVALPMLTLWVALTKPAAWATFLAVGAVVVGFVFARRVSMRRALLWVALAGAGALAAIAAFYADSPSRMYGSPSGLSTLGYLSVLLLAAPHRWSALWGRLGWLDYQLPEVCYGLWLALLVCIVWRDRRALVEEVARWRFPTFAGASLVALFLALHAHEWWGLRERGLYLQGRYLFPLWLGTGVLIVSTRPWHRRVLVGTVIAGAVALIVMSIERYYGTWAVFLQAWPWN